VQFLGYFKSECISAGLSNDGLSLTENQGALTLPAEVYYAKDNNYVFLIIRSGVYSGKERQFGEELKNFIKTSGIERVVVLSSTMSPVMRERDTNKK
jgi:predicted ATP-grasp superfamily ATP-dependent carboligase